MAMPGDLDLVRRLSADSRAVLSVPRKDGTIHSSLVTGAVVTDPLSGAVCVGVAVRGGTVKLRCARRAGRATLVFRIEGEWVAIEGPVRLFGPDDPIDGLGADLLPDLLRTIVTAAGRSQTDWSEFDARMVAERRAAFYVTPARITTNA
jgi:hypothetical protein